jgi:putative ABC transport system substrate-binding protein
MSLSSFARAKSVAVILPIVNDSVQSLQDGFLSALSNKGFNALAVVYNLKEKDAATISGLVAAQKPDIVLAVGSEAANLLKSGLGAFPGVYTLVSNNAEFDSANETGISIDIPAALRVEKIKSVLPNVKRVGVLYSPASESSFDEISAACKAAGLSAVGRQVNNEAEFIPAVHDLMGGQADCLMMILDTKIYFGQTVKTMLLEGIKNKVPVIGISAVFTKAGALMSVDCDYHDVGRQAGELGARILGGEKPSVVKSQRPCKAHYSLNTLVANQLGISLSGTAVSGAAEAVR